MKKKIFWASNFLALTLFSAYSAISTLGLGSTRAYAATLSGKNFKTGQHFVAVATDKEDSDFIKGAHGLGNGEALCTLNDQQVAELDAFFNVKTFDIQIGENTYTIARVSGKHLTKNELQDFLKASDPSLDCTIVQNGHVFFLPVLPQIS